MKISGRLLGDKQPPFIVAEMSGNHNQSLDKALAIVDAAADAGVHALKLQTYTADTLTVDVDTGSFSIRDPNSPWNGKTLYDLYQLAYTPWEWHEAIFKHCRKLGLIAFSSPFDESAVEFLETLNVPAYKIASFENNHLPLIRKAASTGKPLIISIGMATEEEINEAVTTARDSGCKELMLLKCTAAYPATCEDSNLLTIPHLRDSFGVQVGLSDHTIGIGVSVASVALGATMIEKHFTLSRKENGVDSSFSMEPDEMKMLVKETYAAWQALGQVNYGSTKNEEASRIFRRSIYVVEDVKKGNSFMKENLRIIRPGDGLHPRHYEEVLHRKATCDIPKGTPMSWENVQ